ncbi:hypothetical protein Bbelb_288500 [Branchiostoma belcheri]|nr:hypothetical protein Bbelb_288500 [Branchiostoma belcheri]
MSVLPEAFGKVDNIMRSKKASDRLNKYILPMMTYGTKMEMLRVAQRKMGRIMLGMTLRDRKRNSWADSRQECDVITGVNTAKHRWAGHVARPYNTTGGR